MNILIGADPELFIRDKAGNLASAYGLIAGDKKNPFKVEKGAVQVDGMALEFNIDPAASEEEFTTNISTVMAQLEAMIPNHNFEIEPTAEFGKKFIEQQPDKAKELGCDPDYDAYTGEENPKPEGDMGFRTAAGHIHIGWTEGRDIDNPRHFMECRVLTALLDRTLGLFSLFLDNDVKRQDMYGAFGAFRPKSYGVEYRVLSNFWLKDKEVASSVYRITKHVVENIRTHNGPLNLTIRRLSARSVREIKKTYLTLCEGINPKVHSIVREELKKLGAL